MSKSQEELSDRQKEITNCMGKMEEQLAETQHHINKIVEDLAEIKHEMHGMMRMMVAKPPEIVEESNLVCRNHGKDGGNKSRTEPESRHTNLEDWNDDSRHGHGDQNQFLAGCPKGRFAPPEAATLNPGPFVPGLVSSAQPPLPPGPHPSLLASNPQQQQQQYLQGGQLQQQQQLPGMPTVPQLQPGQMPMVLTHPHGPHPPFGQIPPIGESGAPPQMPTGNPPLPPAYA